MSRNPLPPPDASGTDPDSALKQRFSIGPQTSGPVLPNLGTFSATPESPPPPPPAPKRTGSRPDPEGMRRASYYVTAEAADAMDAAVNKVVQALGGDLPKHVALSALLQAAASQAGAVAAKLHEDRAAALAEQLKLLQADDDA